MQSSKLGEQENAKNAKMIAYLLGIQEIVRRPGYVEGRDESKSQPGQEGIL